MNCRLCNRLRLFFFSIFKSNRTKIGYTIQLMFKLTQNKRDKELLELVAKFVNCGAVYSHGENAFDFTVSKFADNLNIIIPRFFCLKPTQFKE